MCRARQDFEAGYQSIRSFGISSFVADGVDACEGVEADEAAGKLRAWCVHAAETCVVEACGVRDEEGYGSSERNEEEMAMARQQKLAEEEELATRLAGRGCRQKKLARRGAARGALLLSEEAGTARPSEEAGRQIGDRCAVWPHVHVDGCRRLAKMRLRCYIVARVAYAGCRRATGACAVLVCLCTVSSRLDRVSCFRHRPGLFRLRHVGAVCAMRVRVSLRVS